MLFMRRRSALENSAGGPESGERMPLPEGSGHNTFFADAKKIYVVYCATVSPL